MNTGNKTQDARSRRELKGVKPELVAMVKHLSLIYPIVITDGLRTPEEQARYVLQGKSKTLNSKHLTGDAVDILRFDLGRPHWELPLYAEMARTAQIWANANEVRIRWGGSWDCLNNQPMALDTEEVMKWVDAYSARCRKARKRPLIDGPHFELVGPVAQQSV